MTTSLWGFPDRFQTKGRLQLCPLSVADNGEAEVRAYSQRFIFSRDAANGV